MTWNPTADQLLAESAWLRRLAARLADDRNDADDLVQDAWIAAWQKQPDSSRPLRPWLAKVVRDSAGMRRRAEARRRARDANADTTEDVVSSPEELLAQARLYQLLVDLVLKLKEPYRSSVLASYVEGLSSTAIARACGVPEGTVRWRLNEALRQLRNQLDARATRRWSFIASPALWMSKVKTATVIAVAVIVLLLALMSIGRFSGRGNSSPPMTPPISRTDHPGDRPNQYGAGSSSTPTWVIPADRSVRSIEGRVIHEDGRPVVGATVELQTWASIIDGRDEATFVTTTDGTFRFQPRWSGRYVLVASAPKLAPATLSIDPRAPSDAADPQHLVLVLSECSQSVEGTIMDAGGGHIAQATIRRILDRVPGPFGISTRSDNSGRYTLCLPRGPSWLDVGADGYEHVLREVVGSGRQIVDVALVPGASIVGQVVESPSGRPIAGVQVGLWPVTRHSGEGSDRNAVSDADGRFTVDGLAFNRYQVTAWDRDHTRTVIDEVTIDTTRPSRPLVIRMERGVDVRGVIRSQGQPIAGARISLELSSVAFLRHLGGSAASTFDTVSDTDGTFLLHGVPRANGLLPQVVGYKVLAPTAIDAREPVAAAVIEVSALATLRGRVVRDGLAVVDAEVKATSESAELTTRSDTHGEFQIVGASAGTYQLSAVSERLGAFSTAPVSVVAPSDVSITIELDGGATIDGTVTDENGAAFSGAQVIASRTRGDDSGASVSGGDGRFSIGSLAGGDYKLTVRPYSAATRVLKLLHEPDTVTLANGHAHAGPIAIVVARNEHAISGTVVDHDSSPVADAIVRLGPASAATAGMPIARTDTDGGFRLIAAGDGPFTLDAGTGSGPRATLSDVSPGATGLVLKLLRPGELDGTLIGLSDAEVWVRRVGISTGATSGIVTRRVHADGDHFICDDIMPGDYVVTAITPTSLTEAVSVHVDEGAVVPVTLKAHSARTISGQVTRVGKGEPVAGLKCVAAASVGDMVPAGIFYSGASSQASSDPAGQFSIESAPEGQALVVCFGSRGFSTGATVIGVSGTVHVEVATSADQAPSIGIALDPTRLSARVAAVTSDEASRAGIQVGDRVVAVDGLDVSTLFVDTVFWLIAGRASGSLVTLKLERNGRTYGASLTAGASR